MFSKVYEKIKSFIIAYYKEIIFLVLFTVFCFIKIPYVIEIPGGTVNLNERIIVEDAYPTEGEFGMAYVTVLEGRLPLVLASFIIPNWDLIKESDIVLDNESLEDMYKRDRLLMEESTSNAMISAFNKASKTINIISTNINVAYIFDEAQTDLEIGDRILEVNGVIVNDNEELVNYINSFKAGDVIELLVLREGEEKVVKSTLYDNEGSKVVGVLLINTYEFDTELSVEFDSNASESGPSGGLMMSLSIYNYLTPEDITKGRKIIGTGTINEVGEVGEIGGIKYKLLGTEADGADIFFCPMANLDEALEVKKENDLNFEIIGVNTLDDAVEYLKK